MKAFLTGLGIGVGLGVLFAPDRGEATRTKLRERFDRLFRNFGRQVKDAKAAVDETIRATRSAVKEVPGQYWAGKMEGGKEGDRRVGVSVGRVSCRRCAAPLRTGRGRRSDVLRQSAQPGV